LETKDKLLGTASEYSDKGRSTYNVLAPKCTAVTTNKPTVYHLHFIQLNQRQYKVMKDLSTILLRLSNVFLMPSSALYNFFTPSFYPTENPLPSDNTIPAPQNVS
jgi:hypothetical protein